MRRIAIGTVGLILAGCPLAFEYSGEGSTNVDGRDPSSPTVTSAVEVVFSEALGASGVVTSTAATTSDTSIQLRTETENATIYYTTDGTRPDPGNGATRAYSGSIALRIAVPTINDPTATVRIRAIGIGPNMRPGPETDVTITVTYPPTAFPTNTITYDANEPDSGTAPESQTKIQGFSIDLATNDGNLQRTEFEFVGWNTQPDGSGVDYAEGSAYAADADLQLFARWTNLPTFEIVYLSNGATGGAVPASQTKIEGIPVTIAANTKELVRDLFTFAGWGTDPDGTVVEYTGGEAYATDAPLTLYAQWTPLGQFAVTYDANGSTSGSVPDDQTKIEGLPLTLATNSGNLQRTGFEFVGWNTEPDGEGDSYAPGATFVLEQDIVLYAEWAEIPAGSTITITNPSDPEFALNPAAFVLRPSGPTTQTVTVDLGPGVTVSSYLWGINNTGIGSDPSVTISTSTSGVVLGTNTLTVVVEIDGIFYSESFFFTVEN